MPALILGVLILLTPSVAMGQQTYVEAYLDALENNKPLLVLVESNGCPPCAALKRDTLSPMLKAGELEDMAYAIVNSSKESDLAQKLQTRNTPTLILFYKRDTGWVSHRLVGNQTKQRVRTFLGRARMVRAEATSRAMLALRQPFNKHNIVARHLSPEDAYTLHDEMQETTK